MVAARQEAVGGPKATIYPHASHDCWIETYGNLELYASMLKKDAEKV
jgi:hypothetical protein